LLINKHSAVVDLSKKCRKMIEAIGLYKGMSEKQIQELKLNDRDNVIEQEKLDELKKEVEEANQRRMMMEKQFEGI
jgi:hypothetical protein